jgi:hypothetical protein
MGKVFGGRRIGDLRLISSVNRNHRPVTNPANPVLHFNNEYANFPL